MIRKDVPKVLSIAGSDNCAGAGIQADIKTCRGLGAYCATVISAVTAQNDFEVRQVQYVGDDMLRAQLDTLLSVYKPDAVKIGMIAEASAVGIISEFIRNHELRNVVVDPVLKATSGGSLSGNDGELASLMIQELFPLASVITPNLIELEQLLHYSGMRPDTKQPDSTQYDHQHQDRVMTEALKKWNAESILVKGGHSPSLVCSDTLYYLSDRNESTEQMEKYHFSLPRANTRNTHGTGCVLSSGIAACLARGYDLESSIRTAKSYVYQGLDKARYMDFFPENGPLWV